MDARATTPMPEAGCLSQIGLVAVIGANELVKCITVAYRAGTVPLSVAGEAGEDRRQIELKLLVLSPDAVEEVNKSSK
jgi:hypothetical protein